MLIEDFNHGLDVWIKELEGYDFVQLCTRPTLTSWSLGQVYMHLISDTKYYIEQIKICIVTDDHANDKASPEAKTMFLNNDFPDVAIEGAPTNAYIAQPTSKEQLINDLFKLRMEMIEVSVKISVGPINGKAKHLGLGYFSANEWLQFAEMHLRHHLRQKKRINRILNINTP